MIRARYSLNNYSNLLLDWIFPTKCPICRALSTVCPCEDCLQSLSPDNIEYDRPTSFLDGARAIYRYQSLTVDLVQLLKYQRQTNLSHWMAAQIKGAYDNWLLDVDYIVPVPVHRTRLAWRGFNQSHLLCTDLPEHKIIFDLVRMKRTRAQFRLSPLQRQQNLVGAFMCNRDLKGKKILLIDDVITTGATAHECAKVLKESGAIWVGLLTFAGTPR